MNDPSIAIHLPTENKWYASTELARNEALRGQGKPWAALIDLLNWWHNGNTDLEVQSSGSTGTPKILKFSREQVKVAATLSLKAIPIHTGQHALLAMDLKYVGAKMLVLRSLMANAQLTVVPPSANPLLTLTSEKFHYTAFVPFQISQILSNPISKDRLNNTDTVLIGGGSLQPREEDLLEGMKVDFIHTYGMSETLSHVAIRRLKDRSDGYTLLEGYDFRIGEDGCLILTTPFCKDEIKTRDLAQSISKTTFRLLGRADFMINSGGVKLFPDPIELKIRKAIQEFSGIHDFMLTGIPDAMLGEKLIMLIEGSEGLKGSLNLILEKIGPLLGRYEVPKEIHLCKRLVRNENGKVDRVKSLAEFLKGR